jgi:hypothetical protein
LEDVSNMVLKKINDWENISVLQRGRLPEHAYFLSFSNEDAALTYERGNSKGLKLLNGKWKFHYAENPSLAPSQFFQEDFDVSMWGGGAHGSLPLAAERLRQTALHKCSVPLSC